MRLFAIFTLLISIHTAQANMQAYVVNHNNQVVGKKQINDLTMCGQSLGPAYISETPIAETGQLFLECSSREDQMAPLSTGFIDSEVRTLVDQGPTANRIDLTIIGDGYTLEEKDQFFADAEKIVEDLFGDSTFATYLPLFNVHAVYVKSRDSGIGNGRPKDTALKLYRHPQYRQAIMPGNSGAAYRASQLAPDSDYPILVANDPFYGGLGGQFAITSNAPLNITTVLRHELGHNFGRVGEEYDGGQAYRGANFSRSANAPWRHWAKFHGHDLKTHRAQLLHYSAPWKNLKQSPWSKTVNVPQSDGKVFVDFSSLGFESREDVQASVGGQPQYYDGEFNYDRNFYSFFVELEPGRHTVKFVEKRHDENNILSKVAIYSMPTEYPLNKGNIASFATYDSSGRLVGYRPTHDTCLMRNMKSRQFCDVCIENMWHNFLREVSLIDSIKVTGRTVAAKLIPLGDRIQLEWLDPRGQVASDLTGKNTWNKGNKMSGRWTLRAHFLSDEVKMSNHESWSVHTKSFNLY